MLGVLIMNTGTPDAPTPEAIRPYLKEFLSDRNLIDCPPCIWQPILNLFILPNRPKRTARIYRDFWTPEGSPFLLTSMRQRDALRGHLERFTGQPVAVELGMRYGNPSIRAGVEALLAAGATELVGVPLYPQHTKSCAGTCRQEFDRVVAQALARRAPSSPSVDVRFVDEFWNAPGYVEALSASVRTSLGEEALRTLREPSSSAKFVVSFHSIPVSHVKAGDTYPHTTRATFDALVERLAIAPENAALTYQCRFDNRKWVGPLLPRELARFAAEGVQEVYVLCPGFAADCTETVYEVGKEAAELFESEALKAHTAEARLAYLPALGADDAFMEALAHRIASME